MPVEYGNQLVGTCIASGNAKCTPFREIGLNVISTTFQTIGVTSNYYCGKGPSGINGTQQFEPFVLPSGVVYRQPVYNLKNTTVEITHNNNPVYVNPTQLAPWRLRDVFTPNPYRVYATGPATTLPSAVSILEREAVRGTKSYPGRYDYDFLLSSNTVGDYALDGTPITAIDNWLSFVHPGDYIYTTKGIPYPFLIDKYYEQGGSKPPSSPTFGQYMIPFCNPVQAYNSTGTLLGSYVGLTFSAIFGVAALTYPIDPFRPVVPYGTTLPPPSNAGRVNQYRQFWSCELNIYIVGSNNLNSPLIGKVRYWMYNNCFEQGSCPQGYLNPCAPRIYTLFNSGITSVMPIDCVFNLTTGGVETIQFSIGNLNTYITP